MADGNSSFGFGARILVILYGLGLALIGWYPIKEQYGGMGRFVSQHLTSLDKMKDSISLNSLRIDSHSLSEKKSKGGDEVAAVGIGGSGPSILGSALGLKNDEGTKRAQLSKEEHLDRITKKDKKELDSLLNNIDK